MRKFLKRVMSLIMAVAVILTGMVFAIPEVVVPEVKAATTYAKAYTNEWYYPKGATFISDFAVYWSDKRGNCTGALSSNGWNLLDMDLNQGAGGKYIYMGYTTTTDISKAVRALDFIYDKSDSTYTYNINGVNVSYEALTQHDGHVNLNKDSGTGDKKIYALKSYDYNAGSPIWGAVVGNETQGYAEGNWSTDPNQPYVVGHWIDGTNSNGSADLNKSAGGDTPMIKRTSVHVDSTALRNAMNTASTYIEEKSSSYTAASIATLKTARDNAYNNVIVPLNQYAASTNTQADIDSYTTAINNAINALQTTVTINPKGGTFGSDGSTATKTVNVTVGTATTFNFDVSPYAVSRKSYVFKGWSTSETAASGTTSGNISLGLMPTIYAQWTLNKHNVQYDVNHDNIGINLLNFGHDYGGIDSSMTVSGVTMKKTGDDIVTISGTSAQSGTFADVPISVSAGTYTFSSVLLGGSMNTDGGTLVLEFKTSSGDNVAHGDNVVRSNFDFKATKSQSFTFSAEQAATIAYVRFWFWYDGSHTLKFNDFQFRLKLEKASSNTGSSPAAEYKVYDATYGNLPSPTRTGYTFDGWYTATSGGTKINSTDTVKLTAGTTLYAHWTPLTYTVSFQANGGTPAPSPITVTFDQAYGTLPLPVLDNHGLDGWYTEGGTKITADTIVKTAENHVLYAHWSLKQYNIEYNGNGATGGSTAPTTYIFDEGTALAQNGFEKKYTVTYNANDTVGSTRATGVPSPVTVEWIFSKWNTKADGTGFAYAAGQTFTNPFAESGTLYAIWAGGNTTLPTPSREGYIFGGWYAEAACVNKIGDADELFHVTSSQTLYAKWTPITYTIVYNANSGSGTMASTAMTYDKEQRLTPNAFTKTGYTFTGWKDDNGKSYSDNQIVYNLTATNGAQINMNAQWQADTHTVTFDATGGIISENGGATISRAIQYDQAYGALPATTFIGHTFLGWYTAKEGGTKVEASNVFKSTTDQTLYAHWGDTTSQVYTNEYYYPEGSLFVEWVATQYATKHGQDCIDGVVGGGYTPIYKDFNDGNKGSNWVYMGYRTTTDISRALRSIDFSDNDGSDTIIYNGCTYYIVGKDYGTNGVTAPGALLDGVVDLNREAGGWYIYAFASRDCSAGAPIIASEITMDNTSAAASGKETAIWLNSSKQDQAANVNEDADNPLYFHNNNVTVNSQSLRGTIRTAETSYLSGANRGYYTADTITALETAVNNALNNVITPLNTYAASTNDQTAINNYETAINTAINNLQTTVTLDANGTNKDGTKATINGATSTTTNVTVGTKTTIAEFELYKYTPVRKGYTFMGWSTDKNAASGSTSTIALGLKPTVYATWQANTYDVIYDGTSKTGGYTEYTRYTYDVAFDLRDNGFEKIYTISYVLDGGSDNGLPRQAVCALNGWSKEPNGTVAYSNKQNVLNPFDASDGTLYAQWGSGSVKLANTEKTGYTFEGWYTDSAKTQSAGNVGETISVSGNMTLYAKWTANKYTVVYDGNGATGKTGEYTSDRQQFTYDEAQNIYGEIYERHYTATFDSNTGSSSVVTKTNHKAQFMGWQFGEDIYTSGSLRKNLTPVMNGEVTLKAVWGGGDLEVLTMQDREGYKFLGWANTTDNPNANEVDVAAGSSIRMTKDMSFKAIWLPVGEISEEIESVTEKSVKVTDGIIITGINDDGTFITEPHYGASIECYSGATLAKYNEVKGRYEAALNAFNAPNGNTVANATALSSAAKELENAFPAAKDASADKQYAVGSSDPNAPATAKTGKFKITYSSTFPEDKKIQGIEAGKEYSLADMNLNHYDIATLKKAETALANAKARTDDYLSQTQLNNDVVDMATAFATKKSFAATPYYKVYENAEKIVEAGFENEGITAINYVYAGKGNYTYYCYTNSPNPVMYMSVENGTAISDGDVSRVMYPTKTTAVGNMAANSYVLDTKTVTNNETSKFTSLGIGGSYVGEINGKTYTGAEYYNRQSIIKLTPTLTDKQEAVYTFTSTNDALDPSYATKSALTAGKDNSVKDIATTAVTPENTITIVIQYHSGEAMNVTADQVGADEYLNQFHLFRTSGGASNWELPASTDDTYTVYDNTYGQLGTGSFVYTFTLGSATDLTKGVIELDSNDISMRQEQLIDESTGEPVIDASTGKPIMIDTNEVAAESVQDIIGIISGKKTDKSAEENFKVLQENFAKMKSCTFSGTNIGGSGVGFQVWPQSTWSFNYYPASGVYSYAHIVDRWGNTVDKVFKTPNIDSKSAQTTSTIGALSVVEDGGSGIATMSLNASTMSIIPDEGSILKTDSYATQSDTLTIYTGEANKKYTLKVDDAATNSTSASVTTDAGGYLTLTVDDKANMGAMTFTLNGITVTLKAEKPIRVVDVKYTDTGIDFDVTVDGRADKIQLVDADGNTRTYSRDQDKVSIKSYAEDGTEVGSLSRELSYEVWSLTGADLPEDTELTAYTKIGNEWNTDVWYTFEVTLENV